MIEKYDKSNVNISKIKIIDSHTEIHVIWWRFKLLKRYISVVKSSKQCFRIIKFLILKS